MTAPNHHPGQPTAPHTERGAPLHAGPPVLCGGDFEFGNFIEDSAADGPARPFEASLALLREIDGVHSRRHSTAGSGARGAGWSTPSHTQFWSTPSHTPADDAVGPTNLADAQDWGRKFLLNGGCAYIDLNHLELCTPEVRNALDFVAATHACFRIAQRACAAANAALPDGRRLHVLANNSDGQGNSYGTHLNFLISRATFENIFSHRIHYQLWLATYQASSIVFTGQGKVGAENDRPPVPYQLSQRADFLEVICGPQTTFRRPLVNSRDEPLCGAWRAPAGGGSLTDHLARLHVIFYDQTLCHHATFLKVGIMQLLLAMLEADRLDAKTLLAEPVQAVVDWSHDPSLQHRAPMISGQRLTAVETQMRYFDAAQQFVDRGQADGVVPHARQILLRWGQTLAQLRARDLDALAPRLDWVRKLHLIEQAMKPGELGWDSPAIKYLDHMYSNLDPIRGLYLACEARGLVERLVAEEQIQHFIKYAPTDTRAWGRSLLLLLADLEEIDSVDWDAIGFRLPPEHGSCFTRYRTVQLANPLRYTKAELDALWPASGRLEEVIAALEFEPARACPPQGAPASGAPSGSARALLAYPASP
ncbi:MAG: hypothetical protein FJ387_21470 [Verrucomicrobia bacterium]|nr:hypothetical protein [Verrucomicrobiota bacterium]